MHPSPERMPRSNSSLNIGKSPMKEHISNENLGTLDENRDRGYDGDGNPEDEMGRYGSTNKSASGSVEVVKGSGLTK